MAKTNFFLTPNREYKDNLFKFIYGREENKNWLLSLYNSIAGTNVSDPDEIEINTVEDIVYINRKNDVSFLIGTEMYLLEHQSTFNPNLPIRGLIYFAQLYSKFGQTQDRDFYSSSLVKIPSPRFYVLYNGRLDKPDKLFLKLSDAFETQSDGFEWTATMLNVNYGKNENLLKACKSLQDYSMYVKLVREGLDKGLSTNDAVESALDEASNLNLLDGFFKRHKAEILGMCLTEFDQEKYDYSRRMEGYDEGRADGAHDAKLETAKSALRMGLSVEQIVSLTSLPLEEVTAIQAEISATV